MAVSPRSVTFEVTVRPKGRRTRESVIGEVVVPVTYSEGRSEVVEGDLDAALILLACGTREGRVQRLATKAARAVARAGKRERTLAENRAEVAP